MKETDKGWRKPTKEENKRWKKAASNTLKKLGRPLTPPEDKFKPISLRVPPDLLKSFKDKAKKTGKKYQALIIEAMKKAA